MSIRFSLSALAALCVAAAYGQFRPTNVPALSSRAGAPYTLYLNFAGFTFTGEWGGNGGGSTFSEPYRAVTSDYTATQQSEIREIWTRTAEKFAPFGVNVTTIDPAPSGFTDPQRQAWYDQTPRLMHSIITPTNASNNSTAGGVSYFNVISSAFSTAAFNGGAGRGLKTNYTNTPANPTYDPNFMLKSTAETLAHENGHAFALEHQSDYDANGNLLDEYSSNFGAGGNSFTPAGPTGTFAPIMGFSDFAQRGTWREGKSSDGPTQIQDDAELILNNPGIGGFVEDGIGNSFATATTLGLIGFTGTVDSNAMKGIVVPTATAAIDPIPSANYQSGYYRFDSDGLSTITLRATNGSSRITPGVADPGMTLRNSLSIFRSDGSLIGTGTEDSLTRYTEYQGLLAAGSYFAVVASTGGFVSAQDPTAKYYNMGSYFLSGTGFKPVPEPASLAALSLGLAVLRRRRKG